MKLSNYIEKTKVTAIYGGQGEPEAFDYLGSGFAGEVGECFEIYKKMKRDDGGILSADKAMRLLSELGDVCWYIGRMLGEINAKIPAHIDEIKDTQVIMHGKIEDNFNGVPFLRTIKFFLNDLHFTASQVLEISDKILDEGLTQNNKDLIYTLSMAAMVDVCVFAEFIGIDIRDILKGNIKKLFARKDAGKLKGSGETLDER